jgi:hypothetical protein
MSYQALQQVQKEVREGNVSERPHGNLCIYKYTQKCVMDKAWNDVNSRCRGIIFDTTTGAIVSRSFNKFFNQNERPQTETKFLLKKAKTIPFQITEKMDGSMISLHFYNNHWQCATPGSITSEQALYATAHLLPKYDLSMIPTDITLVCEMISPMDREDKVIVYGDRDELVLLTAFENKWDQIEIPFGRVQYFSKMTGIPLVSVWQADYENFLSLEIPDNTEGYVIAFEDSLRIKVKSMGYLRAFRLVCEFSRKHLMDYIEQGEYHEAVKILPDLKRQHFDDIYAQVMTIKGQIELEAQEWFVKCDPTDLKKSAQILDAAGPVKSLVFMLLRNKSDEQMKKLLWKLVRERFQE